MARIPRMTDQRQQSAALPDASINPAMPAGTFGPDLTGVTREVTQIALKAREKADTAMVMEADSALTEFENTALYDPESGAFNLRGKNAFEVPDKVLDDYDATVEKIRGNLNGRQIEAFNKLAKHRREQMGRALQRHLSREIQTYEQQQAETLVAGSQITAAHYYNDPERIAIELQRQRGAIMARSADMGWSPERTQFEIRKATSLTHGGVIDRMAANDPGAALAYYAEHGPDMTPQDRVTYDKITTQIRTRRAAEQAVERIVSGLPSDAPRSQQMAALVDLPKDVREAATARLNAYWKVQDQQLAELYEAVQLEVENGTPFDQLPPQALESLKADQLKALKARAKDLAGGDPVMDWGKWTEISTMSRAELAQIDNPYTELRPYLDDSHYNKALTLINDAKGMGDEATPTSSTLTFNQRVTNAAKLSGIVPADRTPAKYSSGQTEDFARFQAEAAARIEEEERNRGRKLTGNEQQEIIDGVLLDRARVRNRFLPGSQETYLWAMDEDDQGRAYIPREEIPEADYQTIENLMLSNGRVPTRRDIEAAYAQYRLNNREAFEALLRGDQ